MDSLQRYNGAPIFFIPTVVLDRHPPLIAEIAHNGVDIGMRSYVHNKYRTLSKDEQFKQTKQATKKALHLFSSHPCTLVRG